MSRYPTRPPAPMWARCAAAVFGLAVLVSSAARARAFPSSWIGIIVGVAWLAFGLYGGLPLVATVEEWRPIVVNDAIDESHLRGLRVLRRRGVTQWVAIPATILLIAVGASFVAGSGREPLLLLLAVPLLIVSLRYHLSRCPRCGYGFFTRTTSRIAALHRQTACGHCRLSLDAR